MLKVRVYFEGEDLPSKKIEYGLGELADTLADYFSDEYEWCCYWQQTKDENSIGGFVPYLETEVEDNDVQTLADFFLDGIIRSHKVNDVLYRYRLHCFKIELLPIEDEEWVDNL